MASGQQPAPGFQPRNSCSTRCGATTSEGDDSTVTVHVRRLREKIEPDPAKPVFIRTVWSVGYIFEPEQDAAGD